MKKKRTFLCSVEHARGCAADVINDFLKAAPAQKRESVKRVGGTLAGLFFCGAISKEQWKRMSANVSDIAFPLMTPAEQISEALDRR